jgi:hypothetical protein
MCFESGTTATDIDAVCGCYAANSGCYIQRRCFGMVPDAVYEYCFEELKCTSKQCTGSGAVHAATVSLGLLAAVGAVVVWLAGGP